MQHVRQFLPKSFAWLTFLEVNESFLLAIDLKMSRLFLALLQTAEV